MDKTKSSMYNALTTIIGSAISSILSIIATQLIIKNYGSDFNGVVATVNQVMNVLLIVEGGFTLAINVALFSYYVNKKQDEINSILAAASKIFTKIAFAFLAIGISVSLIYPVFIKSNLDYMTIVLIFIMIVISTFFTLIFTTKYRIMFQTAQKEYVVSLIGMITTNLANLVTIILVSLKANMLIVRFSVMSFVIINGVIIFLQFKKDFSNCLFKDKNPNYKAIKGTKDVMAQKITGAIYGSAPILFISSFVGTAFSSVYTVYNSIYQVARIVINAVISAPVNGFGQLICEKDKKYVYNKFTNYQFIVIFITFSLVTCLLIIIMPFISIYTKDIKDINYMNYIVAYLMGVILILESIHIPSGNIINVSGNFKISKQIQYITVCILGILLLIAGIFGGAKYGLYGILIGTTITNALLAYMEIRFIHKKYFEVSMREFYKYFFVNLITGLVLVVGSSFINLEVDSYLKLVLEAGIIGILILGMFIIVNMVIAKKEMINIFQMIKKIIFKRNEEVLE